MRLEISGVTGDHESSVMRSQEARLSETEPIVFRPRAKAETPSLPAVSGPSAPAVVSFNRHELMEILNVYGRKVAAGEWRDYAIDMLKDKAVFSVFRRASEWPLYRIEKDPKFARKQGAYSVVTPTGLILKRGQDLKRVLGAIDTSVRAVR